MLKYLTIALIFLLGCTEVPDIQVSNGDKGVPINNKSSSCVCPGDEPQQTSEVPYFDQYENSLHPGSSCQNTSVAMVLAHFGWTGQPDDITREWGKDYAQSPSGLANLFNEMAGRSGINKALTPITNGSIEDFRTLLRQGKPTIVHGYFTSYGHVLVALDFDGTHYTVNDPAGCWSETFKGGYGWCPTGKTGRSIRYPKQVFESAINTSDGWSYLPLWFHRLN